jgi:hypothetical protein
LQVLYFEKLTIGCASALSHGLYFSPGIGNEKGTGRWCEVWWCLMILNLFLDLILCVVKNCKRKINKNRITTTIKMCLYFMSANEKVFDPRTNQTFRMFKPSTWKRMKPIGDIPSPRCGHSSIILDENLFLFGGNESESHFSNPNTKLFVYNISSNIWRNILIPELPAKYGNSFLFHEGFVYCVTSNTSDFSVRIEQISVKTGEWKEFSENKMDGVTSIVSILYGDKILTFGGFEGRLLTLSNNFIEFDIQSKKWSIWETSGETPSPRALYSCIKSRNKMVIQIKFYTI